MESHEEINWPLLWLSLAFSATGILLRYYAERRKEQRGWFIIPYLLANAIVSAATAPVVGAVTGFIAGLIAIAYLMLRGKYGKSDAQ